MAAVMFERTVRAFIRVHTLSLLISKGCFSSRYQSSIKDNTHTFTPIPVSLWSDTAADQKSKHSHSLKHTHGHAHASFPTAPKLLRAFQTACHVSHTLSFLQMPTDGGKDCLFLFKQVTTQPSSLY